MPTITGFTHPIRRRGRLFHLKQGTRDPDALVRRAGKRADTRQDRTFSSTTGYRTESRVRDRRGHRPLARSGDRRRPGCADRPPARTAERVTAVERDPDFAAHLREVTEEVAADRLTIVEGDALEVDFPFHRQHLEFPYGVSSEISFRLLPRAAPLC